MHRVVSRNRETPYGSPKSHHFFKSIFDFTLRIYICHVCVCVCVFFSCFFFCWGEGVGANKNAWLENLFKPNEFSLESISQKTCSWNRIICGYDINEFPAAGFHNGLLRNVNSTIWDTPKR